MTSPYTLSWYHLQVFLWLTRKKGPLPRNSDELFTLKAQKNGFKRHLNQFISMFFVKFLMIFFKWRIPKDLLKPWSNITNMKTNYLLRGMPNKLANRNFCKLLEYVMAASWFLSQSKIHPSFQKQVFRFSKVRKGLNHL